MNENLVAAVQHLHAAVAVLCGLLPAGHAADKSLQQAAVALRRLADEPAPTPVMAEEQIEGMPEHEEEPEPAPAEAGDTWHAPERAGPPTER